MTRANFDPLVAAVRANCQVSDARHARNMTMCTYLLEMREQYRWERGFALDAVLPRAEVGAWLSEREAQWDTLEHGDYLPLPTDDALVDPFAAATINRTLVPRGWMYGAGVGRFGKPQFFLAELEREEWRDGVRVLVAGREHARDLAPAPAALRADTIYVRTDVLRRLLWERAELWTHRRAGGAFKAALDACGFADDPMPALERMAEAETETLILHELGERAAGASLSPAWERMLGGLGAARPSSSRARCATISPIARSRCPRCWRAARRRRSISGSRGSTACAASSSRGRAALTISGGAATAAVRSSRPRRPAPCIGSASATRCSRLPTTTAARPSARSKRWPSPARPDSEVGPPLLAQRAR